MIGPAELDLQTTQALMQVLPICLHRVLDNHTLSGR